MLVKICGITNVDDARLVLEVGADWFGLNLVAGPRRIELSTARRILAALNDPGPATVLVRTDGGRVAEPLIAALLDCGVRRVQLYGDIAPPGLARLSQAGLTSILVHHVIEGGSLEFLHEFLRTSGTSHPDYLLFDAKEADRLGGTGRRADWMTIAKARARRLDVDWPPFILAGGLTAQNVAEAIDTLAPYGVDVSSGVESQPGRKDPAKVKAFLAAVRDRSRRGP